MMLKLGDWAYGNQKRVFKYYKELYDEDTERADKVKAIESEMYAEVVTNGTIGDADVLEPIVELETNMNEVPDDDGYVYDNEGNEIDNYE